MTSFQVNEESRGAAAERAREEAQQARIAAYWEALDSAAREAVQERALAQPHPLLSLYRRHRGRGTPEERRYRKLILDDHVLARLQEATDGSDVGPELGTSRRLLGRVCRSSRLERRAETADCTAA
jgi:hypothetical protein